MNTAIQILACIVSWTLFLPLRLAFLVGDVIDRALDKVWEDMP